MSAVRFKGVPFFMAGKQYIIPSLSLKQVEDNHDKLSTTEPVPVEGAAEVDPINAALATFKTYIPIILMAVQRNYPEVTEANLWEWLDMGNFAEALSIVQAASGFKASTSGE
ncbi:MAG: hypothetical protein M3O31_07055 [Acidobacteriota bacterium]|nr:hypothetical protein [Acidobacteriota bacterium]